MRTLILLAIAVAGWVQATAAEFDLQSRIDEAIKGGGGEVIVPAGHHLIPRGLLLKNARHLRIVGEDREKSILQLGPLAFAEAAGPVGAGATEIPVKGAQHLQPGMRLKIEADGEIDSFTKKPKPYQLAMIAVADGSRLTLEAPLKFPIPAGTHLRHEDAPNLLEIRGAGEDIRIENLTMDGGLTPGAPPVRGHAQLCGIFAAGSYSYEKGPTGPRISGVRIARCTIRNFFGRGVALYSVEGCAVEDCTITDTNDEAIDLDHFTVGTVVRRNRIERSLVGVELNDASDCIVEGNDVRNCCTGLNLWRWCKLPGLNERNRITGNSFSDTAGNALQIATGTAANVISGNTIVKAGRNGISLGGAGQVVTGNRISGVQLKPVAVNEGEHELRDNE